MLIKHPAINKGRDGLKLRDVNQNLVKKSCKLSV